MQTSLFVFLVNDDEIQSPIAYRLFEKAVNEELTLVLQKRRRESPTSLEVG
jgi:hypothetical protein